MFSWENLQCTIERQNSEILTYWEQLKNTSQLISAEHECIDRLKATLGEYNHVSVMELNNLANTINTFEVNKNCPDYTIVLYYNVQHY